MILELVNGQELDEISKNKRKQQKHGELKLGCSITRIETLKHGHVHTFSSSRFP